MNGLIRRIPVTMAVPCITAVYVAAQRPDAELTSDDNLLTSSHLPAGEANGNEAGGDATKQPGDDGKGATADDAKEATADDATKADEPDAKRQATEAAKAELAADAPIGGSPKPSNVIEEGRIYFIYRCMCPHCTPEDKRSGDQDEWSEHLAAAPS